MSSAKRPTTLCLSFTVNCAAHASQAQLLSTGTSLTGFVLQGRSANDQWRNLIEKPHPRRHLPQASRLTLQQLFNPKNAKRSPCYALTHEGAMVFSVVLGTSPLLNCEGL